MPAKTLLPLLAALGALSSGAATSPASPSATPPGLIAFARHTGSGTSALYVVRADGSGLRRLSSSPVDHDPVWTPDGRRIVFASSRGGRAGAPELYSRDLVGRLLTRLTKTDHSPARWSANAQPTISPDGKDVVFVRQTFVDGTGTVDLFRTDIDGRNERRLTETDAPEESPAFGSRGELYFVVDERIYVLEDGRTRALFDGRDPAPQGTSLAFARGNGVYVHRSGRVRRIGTGTAPAWSPDGARLVYAGRDGLYTVRPDGSGRRRVTRVALPAADLDPAWRPTGRRLAEAVAGDSIVYATGSSGTSAGRADIYVRTADGGVRRLTSSRAYEGFPSWSPDKRRIVFSRAVGNDSDIYVMNADGTGVRRLAGSRPGVQDLYPAWSPDGRLIAFASNRFGESDVFVMRADGTGLRRLTKTPRYVDDTQPRFSPDGRYVVFASNRLGYWNYELFRIRVSDGGGVKRLTFWGTGEDGALGDDLMPEYSPDGSRIAFVSDRSGTYRVWTMRADGTDVRPVVGHDGRTTAFPRWSRDGRTLLYTTFESDSPRTFELWTVPATGGAPTPLGRGSEGDW